MAQNSVVYPIGEGGEVLNMEYKKSFNCVRCGTEITRTMWGTRISILLCRSYEYIVCGCGQEYRRFQPKPVYLDDNNNPIQK